MINYKIIFKILGFLLFIIGAFLLVCSFIAIIYHEPVKYILISGFITMVFGALFLLFSRKADVTITKREGYIIVTFGWILFSIFGALPFYLSGEIPSYTDAFFETMSGFTTTGASILNDIEALPNSLLFWRSLTQWLGGMGIIVLSLAILPILGIGGMQLFIAEVPGPAPDKIHPRVKETAKRLWAVYFILTGLEIILLVFGGMSLFDAVNHAFTTMATGGYSTKQASVAFYSSPYIQYVITLFMFMAGTNFVLSYHAMHFSFRKVFKNEEFRFYLGFIAAFTIVIFLLLAFTMDNGIEEAFRKAAFQVVSITTTTGYVTADYLKWTPPLIMLIFILMFVGGSAGSTGGGIKIVRILLFFKNSFMELKRLLHPNAIIPVRLNQKPVLSETMSNVLSFITFYIILLITGVIVIAFMGYDLESSFGAVAATLGNIGPGIGAVGPVENFAHFPDAGKWFLSLFMLIGRLELFTVIILFSPTFWKK